MTDKSDSCRTVHCSENLNDSLGKHIQSVYIYTYITFTSVVSKCSNPELFQIENTKRKSMFVHGAVQDQFIPVLYAILNLFHSFCHFLSNKSNRSCLRLMYLIKFKNYKTTLWVP